MPYEVRVAFALWLGWQTHVSGRIAPFSRYDTLAFGRIGVYSTLEHVSSLCQVVRGLRIMFFSIQKCRLRCV